MGKGTAAKRTALRVETSVKKAALARRTHVTQRHINHVRNSRQDTLPSEKPEGLWYEVDGAWRRWCKLEKVDYTDGGLLYALRGVSKLNILYLTTPGEIREFSKKYGVAYYPTRPRKIDTINWKLVASEYDGIEIAPYQRSLRHVVSWYYGWDVASGCIWNPGKLDARYLHRLSV